MPSYHILFRSQLVLHGRPTWVSNFSVLDGQLLKLLNIYVQI